MSKLPTIKVRPRPLTEYERGQYPDITCARIRKPPQMGGQLLDEKGELVPEDTYWLRLLKGGDVVKVSAKPEPKHTPAPIKSKKSPTSDKG